MATLASLVVRMGADITKFSSDMGRADKIARDKSKRITKSLKGAAGSLTSALGVGLGIGAFTAVVGKSVMAANDFETAMSEVSTLLNDTSSIDGMSKSMKEMAVQFGSSATEQAKALYQAISAGAAAGADATALLVSANKLAVGGVTDVKTSVDALTTVMNAYGSEAGDAARVSDIFFTAVKAGKTTVPELSNAIGNVATLAGQMGVSFEETAAAVATFTKAGVATAESTTALRGVLTALAKPSEKAIKLASELGLEFNSTALRSKGLAGFLDSVKQATGGNIDQMAKLFGRVEGLGLVMSLTGKGAKDFNEILNTMETTTGATDAAFEKMAKTAEFRFAQVKAAGQTGLIELGENIKNGLLPVFELMAESFIKTGDSANFAAKSGSFLSDFLKALSSIAIVVKGLFDALIATLFQFSVVVIESLGAVIGPIDAFVSGIAAAAMALASGNFADAMTAIQAIPGAAATAFVDAKDRIVFAATDLGGDNGVLGQLKEMVESLGKVWDDTSGTVGKSAPVFESTGTAVDGMIDPTTNLSTAIALTDKEAAKLEATFIRLQAELDPLEAMEREFNDSVDDLIDLLSSGKIDRDKFDEWLAQIKADYKKATIEAVKFDEGLQEIIVTSKRMVFVSNRAKEMADIIKTTFDSLNFFFRDFWAKLLIDGKFSLSGLKDIFLLAIADIAHTAITKPIILKIQASITAAITPVLTSISTWITTTLAKILAFKVAGTTAGGLLAGAGIGAAVGGATGSTTGGALGGVIGAVIGASLGPIGSVIAKLIGGIIGGFLGGLFKKKPEIRFAGFDVDDRGDGLFKDSALGGIFTGDTHGGVDDLVIQMMDAIVQFDDAMGSFLNADQIGKIQGALENWTINLKGSALTLENVLNSRFQAILGTFGQGVRDYVKSFDGIEAQTNALQRYVTSLNALGDVIIAFVASDPGGKLEEALPSAQGLEEIGAALMDAMANFDNTPEQLDLISGLIQQRYLAEVEFIQAIDTLVAGISDTIGAQIDAIRDAVAEPIILPPVSADETFILVAALQDLITKASAPDEIARLVREVQALIGSLFNSLSPVDQAAMADTLIALLGATETIAVDAAEDLRDNAIATGGLLRDTTKTFAEKLGIDVAKGVKVAQANTVIIETAILEQTLESRKESEHDRILYRSIESAINKVEVAITGSEGKFGGSRILPIGPPV